MDQSLRNNNEIMARKLKAKLSEQYTNFPDVSLAMIRKFENY